MNAFTFPPPPPSTEAEALRAEVRDFLSQQLASRKPVERVESWIGMTWPKQYGGHERSFLEPLSRVAWGFADNKGNGP